jgi:hypothetical protein
MTENAATATDCYNYIGDENVSTTRRRERRDSRIQAVADSSPRFSVVSWLVRQLGPPPPPPRCYFSKSAYFMPRAARSRKGGYSSRAVSAGRL